MEIRGGAAELGLENTENRGGAADEDTDYDEAVIVDMDDEPEPHHGVGDVFYDYESIKNCVENTRG